MCFWFCKIDISVEERDAMLEAYMCLESFTLEKYSLVTSEV